MRIKNLRRRTPKPRDPRAARKVWKMLNSTGHEVLTPWGAKQKTTRRAARTVAKQARKMNRRYRVTGGKR